MVNSFASAYAHHLFQLVSNEVTLSRDVFGFGRGKNLGTQTQTKLENSVSISVWFQFLKVANLNRDQTFRFSFIRFYTFLKIK